MQTESRRASISTGSSGPPTVSTFPRWSGTGCTSTPLEAAEVRVLRYMMDIESHTVIFLRDLLATHAAFDPDVTAFLSCWNYEEFWHGEAFSRLLGEAGIPVAPDHEPVGHDSNYPTRSARIHWIRRRLAIEGIRAATWAPPGARRSPTGTSSPSP